MNRMFKMVLLVGVIMASEAVAYPVQGPGSMSCAEFGKMYQADPTTETMFYTWAQGFWSSMNLVAMGANKQMRELAGDSNQRTLRAFCANNPLKNYMDGVLETYQKLPLFLKTSN